MSQAELGEQAVGPGVGAGLVMAPRTLTLPVGRGQLAEGKPH